MNKMVKNILKSAAIISISLLFLCGCEEKETDNMKVKYIGSVTFINGLPQADVWILPETQENLKTTVWGTACAAKVETGETREVSITGAGDEGFYMFRMIDNGHIYYSADGITLKDGWSLELKEEERNCIILEVKDDGGRVDNTYEVFFAAL